MQPTAVASACEALYEAAIEPDSWSTALNTFARATGSVGCFFYPQHPERTDLQFPASPDLGGFLHDFFEGGWYRTDPRAMRGWPRAESGRSVILEHDIARDDERRREIADVCAARGGTSRRELRIDGERAGGFLGWALIA